MHEPLLRITSAHLLALVLLPAAGCTPDAPEADLVLRSGIVATVDRDRPRSEAIAMAGDTVLALGSDEEMGAYVGPGTRVVDLEGRLAVPGFVESHAHFISLGKFELQLDLLGTRSWDGIVAMVDSAARATEPGEWILGRGWHQEKWERRPGRTVEGFPVNDRLDEVAPRHPVYLTHASGHAVIANDRALAAAGIGPGTEAPSGGRIVRDARGRATGVLIDDAEDLLEEALAASRAGWSGARRRARLALQARTAAREALRHGVTSFHDQGALGDTLELYLDLAEADELGVRLYALVDQREFVHSNLDRLRQWFTRDTADHHLTVRAVGEVTVDGALGSRSAWMLAPYADRPGHTGLNVTAMGRVREIAALALAEGWQVAVHAIGDRANRETLDLFAALWDSAGIAGDSLRWRIEHAQHLHPDDIPRFAEMGVVASMQAIHACSDAPYNLERLGVERVREGAYVWRDLLDAGALVTNGTDAPVEEVDPVASFHCAITRRVQGAPTDSTFFPAQTMTRQEALRSYTINGARAAFQEELVGSLEPGKLADVAVLSRNVLDVAPDSVRSARVDLTVVGGRILWRRGEGFSGLPAPDAPVPDRAAPGG